MYSISNKCNLYTQHVNLPLSFLVTLLKISSLLKIFYTCATYTAGIQNGFRIKISKIPDSILQLIYFVNVYKHLKLKQEFPFTLKFCDIEKMLKKLNINN
ncbi:hypothetical protein BpHYR1_034502 [Brachionus plicatilis]|uniref:Uncharacterized protein n=1 Tax=Brachionus plicatilis TaxID=10195 RepID=A0A3M7RPI5_BRAPC|nr:hypothetical protein BpHYR1_034502 [Brachionus plicatilis]